MNFSNSGNQEQRVPLLSTGDMYSQQEQFDNGNPNDRDPAINHRPGLSNDEINRCHLGSYRHLPRSPPRAPQSPFPRYGVDEDRMEPAVSMTEMAKGKSAAAINSLESYREEEPIIDTIERRTTHLPNSCGTQEKCDKTRGRTVTFDQDGIHKGNVPAYGVRSEIADPFTTIPKALSKALVGRSIVNPFINYTSSASRHGESSMSPDVPQSSAFVAPRPNVSASTERFKGKKRLRIESSEDEDDYIPAKWRNRSGVQARTQRRRGKNKTLEERKFLYQHDHWILRAGEHSVVCKGCFLEIPLDQNHYYESRWKKHRKGCGGIYFKMEVVCLKSGRNYQHDLQDLWDQYWEEDWSSYLIDTNIRNAVHTAEREDPTWLKLNRLAAKLQVPELTKGGPSGPRVVHYLGKAYKDGSYSRAFVAELPNARARVEEIARGDTSWILRK